VNNSALMAILDGMNDLPEFVPCVRLGQPPMTSYEICTTITHNA